VANYEIILSLLVILSFLFKKNHQAMAFLLLLGTFYLKAFSTDFIATLYPLKNGGVWITENIDINFVLNNTARIIQHLFITFIIYLYIYKDRKAFIPILINTMILVLYCASNMTILFIDSYDLQRIIFSYKEILACIIFLSLLDYGNVFYDKLYTNRVFTSGKYISRLFSAIAFRQLEKEKKERPTTWTQKYLNTLLVY